jgi:hypothetical protein
MDDTKRLELAIGIATLEALGRLQASVDAGNGRLGTIKRPAELIKAALVQVDALVATPLAAGATLVPAPMRVSNAAVQADVKTKR